MTENSESPLGLTAHELQSSTARKLRKHMDARLQALRVKNDADLNPEATAKLRGEVKALKNLSNLLALGNPDLTVVADEDAGE